MKLVLKLSSPPFSCNNSHYRNGNRTEENRKWADNIHNELEQYREEMDAFHDFYMPMLLTHSFSVTLSFFLPSDILFTKTGKVSRRSMDLTNIEKGLIDLVFDPRFYKRGHANLNLDDTLITTLLSQQRKSVTNKPYIHITLEIFNNLLL